MRNLTEHLIPFEQAVKRFELATIRHLEGFSLVCYDERSEPLTQVSSLVRNFVELSRRGLLSQLRQSLIRNEFRLSQPVEQTLSIVYPVHRRIDRRRN